MRACAQASAYPGFGKMVVLSSDDHISLCKPPSRGADAYREVMDMVDAVMEEVRQQGRHAAADEGEEGGAGGAGGGGAW